MNAGDGTDGRGELVGEYTSTCCRPGPPPLLSAGRADLAVRGHVVLQRRLSAGASDNGPAQQANGGALPLRRPFVVSTVTADDLTLVTAGVLVAPVLSRLVPAEADSADDRPGHIWRRTRSYGKGGGCGALRRLPAR